MNYLAFGDTRINTLRYVKYLQQKGIPSHLGAAPRKLFTGCGSVAYFSYDWEIRELISPEVKKIYRIDGAEYTVVYSQ